MHVPEHENGHLPNSFQRRFISSQLVVRRRSLLYVDTTDGRRTYFHSVYTLVLFDDLPDLILLRTGQDDHGASVRSVPAMLAVLVLERDSFTAAQAPSVGRKLFIDGDGFND